MYIFNFKSKLFFLLWATTFASQTVLAYELEEVTTQLVLTGGEHISGKHFKCEGQEPYQAVIVSGNDVVIENSLFTGCYASIIISGAENTLIKGNRFEDVGLAIRERRNESGDSSVGTEVAFNEFKGVGGKDCRQAPEWIDGPYIEGRGFGYWACDVYLANAGASYGKVHHNLVDNRGKVTHYIEDFINIGDGSHNYEIKDNILIGSSEENSSSGTAACIIADTDGSHFTISGNQCYNAATSGIANAGGNNFLVEDNLIYITKDHALVTSQHAIHVGPGSGDTTALSTSPYADRGCGRDTYFKNNRAYAYYVDYDASGQLKDIHTTHNFEDAWGRCKGETTLEENHFFSEDPKWKIPEDLFSDLSYPYFSMKKGVLAETITVDEENSEVVESNTTTEPTSEASTYEVKEADEPLINSVGVESYGFILVSIWATIFMAWFSFTGRLRV